MTISELITELTKQLEQHGDMPVALADWSEGYSNPSKSAISKQWIGVDKTYKEFRNSEIETVLIIGCDG